MVIDSLERSQINVRKPSIHQTKTNSLSGFRIILAKTCSTFLSRFCCPHCLFFSFCPVPPTMSNPAAGPTITSDYTLSSTAAPIEHRFNPYSDNGGTILGIAGEDFVVLAGDTRHTTGYSINSRFQPKIISLEENNMLISANGFSADGDSLILNLKQKMKWYKFNNQGKTLRPSSCARLVQHLLYGKRFFPYYVHTIIAGLDENGKGAVYSFDPVGSYEREQCRAGGSAASLIMPFLDNQVNFKNQTDPATGKPREKQYLSLEEVIELVKDAFSSATERHIHVGDYLQIKIVTKDGIKEEIYPLKRD